MFLATTALTDFWETSAQPILFLGEWCLRRDRRSDWENLRYEILSSPWDDREAFYRAGEYLECFCERLLPLLADFLNSLHGAKQDVRYWRILFGDWLMHAAHIYYDRYVFIQKALLRDPNLTTVVLDPADYALRFPPDLWRRSIELDDFNLQLFSELFEALGFTFPKRGLRDPYAKAPARASGVRSKIRKGLQLGLATIGTALHSAERRILIHQPFSYFGKRDFLKLCIESGFRVLPFDPADGVFDVPKTPPHSRRGEIAQLPSTNAFERVFLTRLQHALPATVIEEYEENRRAALAVPAAGTIAAFGGWYWSEAFRFAAAEGYAKGTRLVALQHGGGYGVFRFAPAERHERRVSDRYLVWGWADEENCGGENAPAAPIARFRPPVRRQNCAADDILLVATVHPRYLYRFHSTPVGSQWERYYEWQARFLQAVPDELKPRVRFRGNPYADCGQAQHERLASQFPWLRFDEPGLRFKESLRSARVVVMDHNSTTMLESLMSAVPTVLYWEPGLWELRDNAKLWFDMLRKAEILFEDPESAAAAAARVYPAADRWLANTEIAEARERFLERYAVQRKNWYREWLRLLDRVPVKTAIVESGTS